MKRLMILAGLFVKGVSSILPSQAGENILLHPEFWTKATLGDVREALASGADAHAQDGEEGWTALHLASAWGKSPELVVLLLESGAESDARDKDGWTALHFAASLSALPEVVAVLLDNGADIESRGDNGVTPLHIAARLSKTPSVVELLLSRGADMRARDDDGKTAFDYAGENKHLKDNTALLQRLNKIQ